MDRQSPVFTDEAECQDCYKCLRACPVKAISVSGGHAQIRPEACIACGRCVAACPPKAKRVRDDLAQVRAAVATGRAVASLAPSWVAEFPDLGQGQMVAGLRALGFIAVSETALGARAVSAAVAALRADAPERLWLSTACPSAVDFVRKHRPALLSALTPLASPALAHARMLHEAYPEAPVVLISPCVAKKREADDRPDLLAAAITFADLRRWWAEASIVPASLTGEGGFVLGAAADGALYPVEGGMLTGVRAHGREADPGLASCSGVTEFDGALAGLDPASGAMFVETLACPGGCVNGPGMSPGGFVLGRRARVLASPRVAGDGRPAPAVDTALPWPALAVPPDTADDRAIAEALARTGKRTREDEPNCSGCGYDTCRDFARALVAGRAEPSQCVTWMRRLAQRKANALLSAMPAGAVLVDGQLRLIECNRHFARLTGADDRCVPGTPIGEVVPFARLFRHVLDGQGDILGRDLRLGGRVLNASVFAVEPGQVVGAVLADVTEPAMGRAQVAERAREAIEKHLATVQRIAYLLGENAAETEGLLTQIVDAYGPEAGDGGGR